MLLLPRFWPALLLFTACALAGTDPLTEILALESAPPGVVFEIATRDESALRRAVPQLRQHIARLRQRFPALPIALVSHGREQFALLGTAEPEFSAVQAEIQAMTQQEQVGVHVCGVTAERRGKTPEDFIAAVDVAAEGPAQIRDYEALGYLRIRLRP